MNATMHARLRRHATVVLGLAGGSIAQASIIYSGVVNLNIPSNVNGLYLNVLTGQWNQGGGTGATVPGWDVNPWGTTNLSMFSPQVPAGGAYVLMPGETTPSNVPLGSVISSQMSFGSGAVSTTGAYPFHLNSSDNLVGFRFFNESTQGVHYGYFRMSLSGSIASQPRALVEYFYESTSGAPLPIIFPAPSTAALAGLAALAWGRRRPR